MDKMAPGKDSNLKKKYSCLSGLTAWIDDTGMIRDDPIGA
jgi:hypothetical protein